jgi:hypothetical protein
MCAVRFLMGCADPLAAATKRLNTGPSSTMTDSTTSLFDGKLPLFSAFAAALPSKLPSILADFRGTHFTMEIASRTDFPSRKRDTSRIFFGEMRTCLNFASNLIEFSLARLLCVRVMRLKRSRWRKLA